MAQFPSKVRLFSLNSSTWKQKRDVLTSAKDLKLKKVIITPVNKRLFLIGLVISLPVSVYNKYSSNYQSPTKQELPKYPAVPSHTYLTDSLKKEFQKKLFATANSLDANLLSRPLIKLSNAQTLILEYVETGVCLSDFGQQLRLKNDEVPDFYFTLLYTPGISPTLVLNQKDKTKTRGKWVLSKIWTLEAAEIIHVGWCSSLVCSQFKES